jgi:hypothetical protein
MIQIKTTQTKLTTIRQNDPRFILRDGLVTAQRAGFEISSGCPYSYRQVIQECINNGWLRPVATVYGKELTWDALRD